MTKYVIFNSDDFGISDGVNRGVIEAHLDGLLSSTCTMSHMPAAADGIKQAQAKAPTLGLGLHLTLSFGKPILPAAVVPSLVDGDGYFPQSYDGLMDKLPSFGADELQSEVQAQFDRFVELAGTLPTHIDSHHRGAYLHPASFEAMCKLCAEYDLPMRRPALLYNPDSYGSTPMNHDGTLAQQLKAIYEKYDSPRCTDHLMDTFQWERGSRLELFQSVLARVVEGYTEVICHVGYADGLTESYAEPRENELAAVIHPDLRQTAQKHQIQFITFADLPK